MACRMVMALPAVVSVACAGTTANVMAAVNAGLCTDADASCLPSLSGASSASTDGPAEVWLLQVAAARSDAARMKLPDQEHGAAEEEDMQGHSEGTNMTHVWEKLKVAARVDKLKEAIQALSNSNITQQLRQDLKQAMSSLPLVEQMKQLFAKQWANVSKVADMEDLHSSLLEMKSDSAEASELRRQLQDLQDWPEPVTNVTIADMQHQVTNMWDDLHGKGFSFPDLDKFTAKAEDAVKQLIRTVKNSTDSAKETVHGLVEDIKARAAHGSQS
jgi:hypothetical protein